MNFVEKNLFSMCNFGMASTAVKSDIMIFLTKGLNGTGRLNQDMAN
jgi:hypothetical protein